MKKLLIATALMISIYVTIHLIAFAMARNSDQKTDHVIVLSKIQ